MEIKCSQTFNFTHISCNILNVQFLIQLTAHVTISICYFVMLLNVLPLQVILMTFIFKGQHLQYMMYKIRVGKVKRKCYQLKYC
jgi:hypothetical protein